MCQSSGECVLFELKSRACGLYKRSCILYSTAPRWGVSELCDLRADWLERDSRRRRQKLQTNGPIKRGNLSLSLKKKKKEKLWTHSTAGEVWRALSLSLQSHFDTQTKTIQKTSAPKDAPFKQLHVLHKEHPQSSIRAGEVRLHHGKSLHQPSFHFIWFSCNRPSVFVSELYTESR